MTLRYSDVTPERLYLSRRELMVGAALAVVGLDAGRDASAATPAGAPLRAMPNPAYRVGDAPTKVEAATTYNNFYEFGTNKDDPARLAHTLKPRPWHVQVDGLCAKPRTFDIEEILKQVQPRPGAKYVEFTTLKDPEQFPGQKPSVFGFGSLDWPYTEGLRLDEALHPLTLLTVGMYGQVLPNQNGAPVRIVIPWKYGFKSAKSIVRIRLTDAEPKTAWNKAAPQEYGFYSNVNPAVDHPRWSQATERRIGEFRRRQTLMWNGYDQVAGLYSGMDL